MSLSFVLFLFDLVVAYLDSFSWVVFFSPLVFDLILVHSLFLLLLDLFVSVTVALVVNFVLWIWNAKSFEGKLFYHFRVHEEQVSIIVSQKTVYVIGMKQKVLNDKMAGVDLLGGCKVNVIKSPSSAPLETSSALLETSAPLEISSAPLETSSPLSSSSIETKSSSPRVWLQTLQYGGVLLLAVSAAVLCYCVRRWEDTLF